MAFVYLLFGVLQQVFVACMLQCRIDACVCGKLRRRMSVMGGGVFDQEWQKFCKGNTRGGNKH